MVVREKERQWLKKKTKAKAKAELRKTKLSKLSKLMDRKGHKLNPVSIYRRCRSILINASTYQPNFNFARNSSFLRLAIGILVPSFITT